MSDLSCEERCECPSRTFIEESNVLPKEHAENMTTSSEDQGLGAICEEYSLGAHGEKLDKAEHQVHQRPEIHVRPDFR
jgi:hypothetical protein